MISDINFNNFFGIFIELTICLSATVFGKIELLYAEVMQKSCTFAPDMQFMSQPRYNPRCSAITGTTFRDFAGRVRSRIILNVGFID